MKHLFELECPHCSHSHYPSFIPFDCMQLHHIKKQPMICESCDKGVDVIPVEDEEKGIITYRLWPSLTPLYPAWLFWNPDVSNPRWFRVSKIAVFTNPELLENPDTHPGHIVDERESLKTAMLHAVPYINEGRTIGVGSTTDKEINAGVGCILTSSFILPFSWFPTLESASNVMLGFAELCTAFCVQALQHNLVVINPGGEEHYWNHTLTTSRVIDYMLRNPWFVTILEATANRYYRHLTWRPIIAVSEKTDGVYFNAEFTQDIEPVWVPLYPAEHRHVSLSELVELLDLPLSQEMHLSMAERFSPEREVMYSSGTVPLTEEPQLPEPTVVAPKKPTLH